MTVRYLKRKATLPPSPPPTSRPDVYLAGYRQCIEQVQELLAEQWTDERRQQSGRRVVEHLEACVQRLNVPPPKNRLLSSDKIFSATLHFTPDPVRNSSSSCFSSSSSSSDDDSVEEELITASAVTSRPLHNLHTTEYCDSSPKPMWRPWWKHGSLYIYIATLYNVLILYSLILIYIIIFYVNLFL